MGKKKNRVQRPISDLKNELKEQILLLKNACNSYDNGLDAIGKHIALSIRVLLHHHANSRSLLEQLSLRKNSFYDSAGQLDKNNLLTECNLVALSVSGNSGKYLPSLSMKPVKPNSKKIDFANWWNNPVLKDEKGRFFSRYELVTNVANTDGGAHVDPDLEDKYMDLSRNNSLGWLFSNGDVSQAFTGRPELACMRQIAEELLVSLEDIAPEYF